MLPNLSYLQIHAGKKVNYQLSVPELVEDAIKKGEGYLVESGALTADTGQFTGRSPKDRFIVEDDITRDAVWWGNINQPISSDVFNALYKKVGEHLSNEEIYVRDVLACTSPDYQIGIRVVTENAYQNIFANNIFVRSSETDADKRPEWSILAAPTFQAEPIVDGVPNPNFVIINFTEKIILIAGTGYTGEIKKGIFSVLNFILPHQHRVLSMHCSANTNAKDETALFFGLSGTGKTTLSSDAGRHLIGDDEHGWSDQGIFNIEGGCYAKCVNLEEDKEPEIYQAIKFGSLLENINCFPDTRVPNYEDTSKTENTRVTYPIDYIEGAVKSKISATPKNIFFLTADAFGVIPPISKLTTKEAMYHFISGYTAKVAGTEVGITEPKMVFSACFGEAFIPLHPTRYAELLGEKIEKDNINVWLVNTGWVAGPYGVGRRIQLRYTRSMIRAAMAGELNDVEYQRHPIFGMHFPVSCPGVPSELLNPAKTWPSQEAYDEQANKLAKAFDENFKKYESGVNLNTLSLRV
ncbi:phosphoenolpyruvate carboxykinase (ATP) [Albibacterium profundi]|uniref:Phosphoenolpyruvate carboxykinase (ATP) n=1 Tax=Albibacterium profundi TaxID=3134906 RepID=A0ABV5CGL4_9SPHI